MSSRLSEVEKRIVTVHKLDAVISAMRGLAAARVQEANRHLESIRAYATTIGDAIGEALAYATGLGLDAPLHGGEGSRLVVLFAAEQGFAGTYSDKVFQAIEPLWDETCELVVIGDRGHVVAEERRLAIAWSAPMIAHPSQAPELATRMTDALFRRITLEPVTRVTLVHADPGAGGAMTIRIKELVPFDYARFRPSERRLPPLVTLPPERLLAQLVEEHIFAELIEAVMLSFAAENEARMRAMVAAKDNVSESLQAMIGEARRLRQEDITQEITELATSSLV